MRYWVLFFFLLFIYMFGPFWAAAATLLPMAYLLVRFVEGAAEQAAERDIIGW